MNIELKKEIQKIKNLDDAIDLIKKQAVKSSVVKVVHLTNQKFMQIEKKDSEARVIKSLKLYKTNDNFYILAVYHYAENSMSITGMDIALYDKAPNIPNTNVVIFSLSKLLVKNSLFFKSYSAETEANKQKKQFANNRKIKIKKQV